MKRNVTNSGFSTGLISTALRASRTGKMGRRACTAATAAAIEPLELRTLLSAFPVKTVADSGAGSLRQAIINANAHPGADNIVLALGGGSHTINLASALPDLSTAMDIK